MVCIGSSTLLTGILLATGILVVVVVLIGITVATWAVVGAGLLIALVGVRVAVVGVRVVRVPALLIGHGVWSAVCMLEGVSELRFQLQQEDGAG